MLNWASRKEVEKLAEGQGTESCQILPSQSGGMRYPPSTAKPHIPLVMVFHR